MTLLKTLQEIAAPPIGAVVAPHQERIALLLDEEGPGGRCPNGEHEYQGHCVKLDVIRQYAHQMSQKAHKSDTPQDHLDAAKAMKFASNAHLKQGDHASASELNRHARDHIVMTRHQRVMDKTQPCPPGLVRSKHGHCTTPHEIAGHADGISKIADIHSKHASMHGGAHNHAQAARAHSHAAETHAQAAKELAPLAKQDPGIHKEMQRHAQKASEHGQRASQHNQQTRDHARDGNSLGTSRQEPHRSGTRPWIPDSDATPTKKPAAPPPRPAAPAPASPQGEPRRPATTNKKAAGNFF